MAGYTFCSKSARERVVQTAVIQILAEGEDALLTGSSGTGLIFADINAITVFGKA